jgi:hypothetical protein
MDCDARIEPGDMYESVPLGMSGDDLVSEIVCWRCSV